MNIGLDKNDPNNRYKMPAIVCKVETIKTAILNLNEIGKALKFKPSFIVKFLGIELGTVSSYDEKSGYGYVNGSHNSSVLQNLLEKLIRLFVLCPQCKLPELTNSVEKNKLKYFCGACGKNGSVKSEHKLVKFMTTNL